MFLPFMYICGMEGFRHWQIPLCGLSAWEWTYVYKRIGMCVSLPPLAVAQRMEVTVEEGAETDSEADQW